MLNHITIMGRLTRDPELRYTQSQTPVASFTVAVDRDFASREGGERQTDFIDVVAWRQTAEFVSKYFSKGSMAVVSGRLQIRDWTDLTAISAEAPKSWRIMCILEKANAGMIPRLPEATAGNPGSPAIPTMPPVGTATAAAGLTADMAAARAAALPRSPSWRMMTEICRSDRTATI